MEQHGEEWAAWLREQFDRHLVVRRNVDLVRAGGTKPNGRPVIDASSVTQWLRGRRPSYDLAVATARAFGAPVTDALRAAGYEVGESTVTGRNPQPAAEEQGSSVGPAPQDGNSLRFLRPEGLTDAQWDDLRRQHADYWEYLVNKAAQQR